MLVLTEKRLTTSELHQLFSNFFYMRNGFSSEPSQGTSIEITFYDETVFL